MGFISELRRRNVFRVGAAYAIVAWLLGADNADQALILLQELGDKRGPESASDTEVDIAFNSFNDPILDRPEFLEVRRQLGYLE